MIINEHCKTAMVRLQLTIMMQIC